KLGNLLDHVGVDQKDVPSVVPNVGIAGQGLVAAPPDVFEMQRPVKELVAFLQVVLMFPGPLFPQARKAKIALRDVVRSIIEGQLWSQRNGAQKSVAVPCAVVMMGGHAKMIDAIQQAEPGTQQRLMRESVQIRAVHVGVKTVEMDILLDGRLCVPASTVVATVRVPAVLGIVEPAIGAQHETGASLVHFLSKPDHALPLGIDGIFAGKVTVPGLVARPYGPEIRPVESSKLVSSNQIEDLLEVIFRFRRGFAQVRLQIGGHKAPAVVRAEVVPPPRADIVAAREINPLL